MGIEVKINIVENTLPVELHNKILESDEFLSHYPPPFLYRFRHNLTCYNYIVNFPNVNGFCGTNTFFIRIDIKIKGTEVSQCPFDGR